MGNIIHQTNTCNLIYEYTTHIHVQVLFKSNFKLTTKFADQKLEHISFRKDN